MNWILDAAIQNFFGSVSQSWLARFLEHRIGDKRIIRLIQKWLKAGILEDGIVTVDDRGTGQGSVISPLLANSYLHYCFDLWAERWRRHDATGDMIIVRYADDLALGFEREDDARRFLDAMRARLEEFALTLHPDKTRLIEFGRHAAANREKYGLGKPETFAFLGFTFICSTTRGGRFSLKRKSRRDRLRTKVQQVKEELQRRMHQPISKQGTWLRQVVVGFCNYHAVPDNIRALGAFRYYVIRACCKRCGAAVRKMTSHGADGEAGRRVASQAGDPTPLAKSALCRQTPKVRAACGKAARADLCGVAPWKRVEHSRLRWRPRQSLASSRVSSLAWRPATAAAKRRQKGCRPEHQ